MAPAPARAPERQICARGAREVARAAARGMLKPYETDREKEARKREKQDRWKTQKTAFEAEIERLTERLTALKELESQGKVPESKKENVTNAKTDLENGIAKYKEELKKVEKQMCEAKNGTGACDVAALPSLSQLPLPSGAAARGP